ncbi:MAG: Asp23/Gls24 family envelope stress response protein [Methylocystaceae bacterium]
MFTIEHTDIGLITVSKEAVETVAGLAAIDSYGLVGMVPREWKTGIGAILGLESVRKGVEVKEAPDGLVVDVYIIVGYGAKISVVAENVMQKVHYVLEETAGLKVSRVNVNVQGVKVEKE